MNERFYKFEKLIIDFAMEMGQFEQKSDKQLHILMYLFIHGKLTQPEIKQLSEVFYNKESKIGFSSGSISSYLIKFLELGLIKKKKRYTSNIYFLNTNIFDILRIPHPKSRAEIIKKGKTYFTGIIKNLEQIRPRGSYKNSIKSLYLNRLKEMVNYLDFQIEISEKNLDEIEFTGDPFSELPNDENNSMQKKRGFIEEIENDLIDFISNSLIFTMESYQYSVIVAYLILRKELTQEDLKRLTGYSSGLISQGLNYLIEKSFIRKRKNPGMRQKLYVLDSIGNYGVLRMEKRLEILKKWILIIKETIEELQNREKELGSKNGYFQLLKCFEVLNEVILAHEFRFELISKGKLRFKPNKIH